MRIATVILAALALGGCGGPIDLTESYWPEIAPPAGEEFSWPDWRAWGGARGVTLSTGPFMSARTESVWFLWNAKGLYGRFVGYTAPTLMVPFRSGGRLALLMPGTASDSWASPAGGPETKRPVRLTDTQRRTGSRYLSGYGAVLTRDAPPADAVHLRTRFRGPVAKPGQHEGEIFISWEHLGWPSRPPESSVDILVICDRKHGKSWDRLRRFTLNPVIPPS